MNSAIRARKKMTTPAGGVGAVETCDDASRSDGPGVFDPAAAQSVVNELAREEAERAQNEQRHADQRRMAAEREFVELLLRAGEKRPDDANRLRTLIGELGITAVVMQLDVALLVDAMGQQQCVAERQERMAAHVRAGEEFAAGVRKWENEELPRLKRQAFIAKDRYIATSAASRTLETLRQRRPILFESDGPARVLGTPARAPDPVDAVSPADDEALAPTA